MALRRLVGFSGVCVSRELWAHRDRAFGALGRTCPSPPGASCMEKKKKVKYQGQYADHIFILIQIQNFSHGACCELFKGKKAEIILELAREGGPQGGCNMPEQSEVLFRRGCACMPGRSHDREWLSGAPVSPKSSLILPNQG